MVGRKGRAYRDLDCVEFDVRDVGGVEGGGIFSLTIEGVVGGDTTGGWGLVLLYAGDEGGDLLEGDARAAPRLEGRESGGWCCGGREA